MTSSVVGQRRSSKALFKAKLASKKGHDLLVVCCWSDPLQLSESWQNHYIWEVCSANWWGALKTAVPAAALVNRKDPVPDLSDHTRSHNQCFESSANWATNFCLICHIANRLRLLQVSRQLFAAKMFLRPAGGRKFFSTVHWILKHTFLCYGNKQTYFLLAKICWLLWFLF